MALFKCILQLYRIFERRMILLKMLLVHSFGSSLLPRQRIRQRKLEMHATKAAVRPQCNNGPRQQREPGSNFGRGEDWDEKEGRKRGNRKLHWTCNQPCPPSLISEFCSLHQFLIDYDQTWGSSAQTSVHLKNESNVRKEWKKRCVGLFQSDEDLYGNVSHMTFRKYEIAK